MNSERLMYSDSERNSMHYALAASEDDIDYSGHENGDSSESDIDAV